MFWWQRLQKSSVEGLELHSEALMLKIQATKNVVTCRCPKFRPSRSLPHHKQVEKENDQWLFIRLCQPCFRLNGQSRGGTNLRWN